MPSIKKNFRSGQLEISISPMSKSHRDIFSIASRENPKRAFMFISRLFGHHIPVSPDITRDAFQQLAERLPDNLEQPILFVGFAETAITLACGVYQECYGKYPESCLLLSTRHPVDGEPLCEFKEPHSHATDHIVYKPASSSMNACLRQAKTLVLIDDESTTGTTMFNAVKALEKIRKPFNNIVSVNIMDWSANALAAQLKRPVRTVSLLSGQYRWIPDPSSPPVPSPAASVSTRGTVSLSSRQDWGRLGTTNETCEIGRHVHAVPGERILVVGTAEFTWPPFLLAERLQREGAIVLFCATTRSPLQAGSTINSVFSFPDNYGQGINHFIYNTRNQNYDRIILCSETPLDTISEKLIKHFSGMCHTFECLAYK